MKKYLLLSISTLLLSSASQAASIRDFAIDCVPTAPGNSFLKILKVEKKNGAYKIKGSTVWGDSLHEMPVLRETSVSEDYSHLLLDQSRGHSITLVVLSSGAQPRAAILHEGSDLPGKMTAVLEFLDCRME